MATATPPPPPPPSVPVFLLKTASQPADAYEELFATTTTPTRAGPAAFAPVFVPVLEHRLDTEGVSKVRALLEDRQIADGQAYEGMVFTSQRAVEAFAQVVDAERPVQGASWPDLAVPVYSVGPATTRALRAVHQSPPLQVSGDHTGNGEDLAYYMQDHYAPRTRPLLFLVGDKRRDIIPKVMASGRARDGSPRAVVPVDEVVVYGTGEMASFGDDFRHALAATRDRPIRWAVVFSPTGCDSMLRELGWTATKTGQHVPPADAASRPDKVYIATIGPTTRAYLVDTFGVEPDVCAAQPSPQGILSGINEFMARQVNN